MSLSWYHRISLLAAVSVFVVVACGLAQQDKPLTKAPEFSAKGSDGKTHTLASLTKDKPAVLYFIKDGCPVNSRALKYFDRVAKAYKGKVNFVGIINLDEQAFKTFKDEVKPSYTVLFDPQKKIIRSYKAERSPWAHVVAKDQQITFTKKGFSSPGLNDLSSAMAKAAATKVVQVDTTGAPAQDEAG